MCKMSSEATEGSGVGGEEEVSEARTGAFISKEPNRNERNNEVCQGQSLFTVRRLPILR